MTPDNPHSLLGLRSDASKDEVKKAFRKLARAMHPDVSDDPAHVELFKRIIVAYETILESRARLESRVRLGESPSRSDHGDLLVDLFRFWQDCCSAVEKLRRSAAQADVAGERWAASADELASSVLETATGAFVLTFCDPDSPAFREPGHMWIDTRPLLFDDARRFLHNSLHLLAAPDERMEANLVKGALGAVGLGRVSAAVGRGASPVDKELFARAAMSALAAALVEEGLIIEADVPSMALMEASNAVAVARLEVSSRDSSEKP